MLPSKLLVLPKALEDIKEIYRYSVDNWGVDKADNYAQILHNAMSQLMHNPQLGKVANVVRKDLFVFPAQSHHIFYKIYPDKVEVIRVLHQSMLVSRHLE